MAGCYDLSSFHPVCSGKSIVATEHALFIYCPVCGVIGNVEAVSAKISPADCCKVGKEESRTVIGDQSPACNRGEFKL